MENDDNDFNVDDGNGYCDDHDNDGEDDDGDDNNNNNNNNNNNWNLYSAISIHKMFKSAAHCHGLSHSQQRLNGRA